MTDGSWKMAALTYKKGAKLLLRALTLIPETCFLAEHVLHSVQQSALLGFILLPKCFCQLFHQFALLSCELSRSGDLHLHVQISASVAVEYGYTLLAHAEAGSGLCASGNVQCCLAIQRGNFHRGAQSCLGKRYGNGAMQVLAVALKKRMFGDM